MRLFPTELSWRAAGGVALEHLGPPDRYDTGGEEPRMVKHLEMSQQIRRLSIQAPIGTNIAPETKR